MIEIEVKLVNEFSTFRNTSHLIIVGFFDTLNSCRNKI